MHPISVPSLGAVVAVALLVSSASLAFAAGNHLNISPSREAGLESIHPFETDIPGATEAWCDSLPFPYCDEPAPGVGPVPYAGAVPRYPIFGE